MNITVNIDCSPEEARRLMGLPDMAPIHDVYLGKMKDMMSGGGISADMVEQLMRGWAPMGEAGMNAWKQIVDQLSRTTKG